MKKIIVVVLLTLLAISVCLCASAEEVLIDSRDLKITFTGTEMGSVKYKDGSEKPYLSLEFIVENNLSEDISFKNATCMVDGIETDMAVPVKMAPGMHDESIWLIAPNGRDSAYLQNWQTIEMDLTVLYFDTEELLYRFPVHIENKAEEAPQSIPYEAGGPIDIISSGDLTITINSAQMGEGPNGEVLQCSLTVNNGMGHSIDFTGANCVVNGVETTVAVPARAEAGVSDKYLLFMPKKGQSADYLKDVDTLTFDLEVSHSKTGEVICNVPVYIGGDLPGMNAQASSKQDKIAAAKEKAAAVQAEPEKPKYFEPYIDIGMILVAKHDDFNLYFGGWEQNIYDDSASLYFYPLIENWTDHDINVHLNDVKFDLVDVGSSSCFDVPPGDYTDDYYLFFEDNVGGDNPLVNPDWITFTVLVKDSDNYDLIAEIPVSLPGELLNQIPDEYPWEEDSYSDYTYEEEDSYPDYTPDDDYYPDYTPADDYYPDYTYEEDYYPDYTYEDESACHLQIFPGAYCSWDGYAEGMMDIRVEVANTHPTKTVKNFELRMYGVEPDGDRLPGDNRYYYQSTVKRIKPGEIATCDDFYIFGQTMEKVYFAVSYVEYTDGSVEIVQDDDLNYWWWTID